MAEYRFREPMSDVALASSTRLVYYWLRTLAAPDGHCYALVSDIARRVGISNEACSGHVTALEDAGYISGERVSNLGRGRKRFRISAIVAAVGASAMLAAAPVDAASLQAHHEGALPFYYQDPGRRRKRRPQAKKAA